MAETIFKPGMYRTIAGNEAEVFAERDNTLYGRVKSLAGDSWHMSQRRLDGRSGWKNWSLVPPKHKVYIICADGCPMDIYCYKSEEKALLAAKNLRKLYEGETLTVAEFIENT